MAAESHGLLLFCHSQTIDAGPTKAEVSDLLGSLEPDAAGEPAVASQGNPNADEQIDVTADQGQHTPPTQVALVDLLQLLAQQRGPRPAYVSFVISAWDLVAPGMTPDEFLSRNLPLLEQYIRSNAGWLQFRAYGLSAQGGDYGDEVSRRALAAKDVVERAIVLRNDGTRTGVEDIALWGLGRPGRLCLARYIRHCTATPRVTGCLRVFSGSTREKPVSYGP